jgi:hypothetical protein
VPHLPQEVLGFEHIATEVFFDEPSSHYTVCSGSGEDPKCSDQFDFDTYISDHLDYMAIQCCSGC